MSSVLPQHVHELSLEVGSRNGSKPSLKLSVKLRKWFRMLLSDPSTRNLFMFLLINLSFAFVELVYGMWTNSLGLISDAFHMFFDCTALLAGLVATVVSKWPPNERFSYGYVRAEVIAGFVNALFLLFIAFFIFAEAIERAFEPPQVKHDRLLIISIGGFIVNLIGIFAFHHGGAPHDHSHHGHSHSHGHAHHDHNNHHSHYNHVDNHAHKHSHGHSHGGCSHQLPPGSSNTQIMQGIFLHILADTLGSVGVIVSSILIQQFGWMISDPICSMFIAGLITMSVYPLMRDSLGILMQRTPPSIDHTFSNTLRKINENESVAQVLDSHVWTLCSNVFVCNLRVEVFPGTDLNRMRAMIKTYLSQVGIEQTYVELVYTV